MPAHNVEIVDCSVHNERRSHTQIVDYMSSDWREYLGRAGGKLTLTGEGSYDQPPAAHEAVHSPDVLLEKLMGLHAIGTAILNFGSLVHVSGVPNPHLAAEIARAANDWLSDVWLSTDTPLFGSVLVANQLPEVAAEEIRRVGGNPRIVQVVMAGSGIGHPLGHPLYHPIYEAAAEMGLPVALRSGAQGGTNPTPIAGGDAAFAVEHHALASQAQMTSLASLIASGIFEKYPELRVVLDGGGVTWISPFLWRYDASWKGVRREIPWARRLPSEYFREHIRVTTASLELAPVPEAVHPALESIGGDESLVFASDYPLQDPALALKRIELLPASWTAKVMHDNPLRTYRWPDAVSARTERNANEGGENV